MKFAPLNLKFRKRIFEGHSKQTNHIRPTNMEEKMRYSRVSTNVAAAAVLLGTTLVGFPAVAADKLSIAVPGVPPVFSTVMIYTSKHCGIYKKHGLDVTIRPFR